MNTIPVTDAVVRGAAELEPTPRGVRPHRLPADVRRRDADDRMRAMEAQPSGVRVVVETTATRVELAVHATYTVFRGLERPRGRIDVVVDGALHRSDVLTGGDRTDMDLATGAAQQHSGPEHVTVVDGLASTLTRVEFWLPHNESVELVALRADAPLAPAGSAGLRWVHHGSSISHGSNALAPSEIWPAVAARTVGGVELCNLGFGGSAMVDPFVARVIRDAPADVISVKLGINVVNLDAMKRRVFEPAVHGFLDTIRDGHPTTPILLVSPLFCGIHEHTPGPGAFDPDALARGEARFIATGDPADVADGRLTLEVIREALGTVAAQRADDANLHLVDGLELYGAADAERMPLPDALHPGPEAHRVIGERFASHVARVLAPV